MFSQTNRISTLERIETDLRSACENYVNNYLIIPNMHEYAARTVEVILDVLNEKFKEKSDDCKIFVIQLVLAALGMYLRDKQSIKFQLEFNIFCSHHNQLFNHNTLRGIKHSHHQFVDTFYGSMINNGSMIMIDAPSKERWSDRKLLDRVCSAWEETNLVTSSKPPNYS